MSQEISEQYQNFPYDELYKNYGVRTVLEENEPHFLLHDIATAADIVSSLIDDIVGQWSEEDKQRLIKKVKVNIRNTNRLMITPAIIEPGVHRILGLLSNIPKAQQLAKFIENMRKETDERRAFSISPFFVSRCLEAFTDVWNDGNDIPMLKELIYLTFRNLTNHLYYNLNYSTAQISTYISNTFYITNIQVAKREHTLEHLMLSCKTQINQHRRCTMQKPLSDITLMSIGEYAAVIEWLYSVVETYDIVKAVRNILVTKMKDQLQPINRKIIENNITEDISSTLREEYIVIR